MSPPSTTRQAQLRNTRQHHLDVVDQRLHDAVHQLRLRRVVQHGFGDAELLGDLADLRARR
ncbi:hypothetical protein ABT337_13125 [Saccharopolyspora hirsuta]|uniref:hypothetical protein n=1 Tax=Saccharopolyspora hirsuta TaxID=1837 RepID=UPI00332B1AC6